MSISSPATGTEGAEPSRGFPPSPSEGLLGGRLWVGLMAAFVLATTLVVAVGVVAVGVLRMLLG